MISRLLISFVFLTINTLYLYSKSGDKYHKDLKFCNLQKHLKIQLDTSTIRPEQAVHFIGKLVKVSAYVHHSMQSNNAVILFIHNYPAPQFKPPVIIKPIDYTKPLMTITLTKSALKRYKSFQVSNVVATGIMKIRSGLPNLSIRDERNIELFVTVE